jgi:hypothetical protein
MTWRVLAQASEGSDGVNEDLTGWAGEFAWVLDGATPLSDERVTDAESDARWLVEFVDAYLREHAPGDRRPLPAIVEDTIEQVRRASHRWREQPDFPPSAAFALVGRRDERFDYLVLGDVTAVLDRGGDVTALTDPRVDASNGEALAQFEQRLRETGSHARARANVREALVRHRMRSMNRGRGYWVLATEPAAARHAVTGSVPDADVRRVALCTDGFSRLVDVFGAYPRWRELLDRVGSDGDLDALLRELRSLEAADPETLHHPRWTVSDDAAALIVAPA